MAGKSSINTRLTEAAEKAEAVCAARFCEIDRVSQRNTARVLAAFSKHRVSDSHFTPTTGYGYNDRGRDTLDAVYADVFGCEDALVRTHFVNGTHAIACALFAVLRPGDTLLAAAGKPYDTLESVIGISKSGGSLREFGVNYAQIELADDFDIYLDNLAKAVSKIKPRAVLIQRSRGYSLRKTLCAADIGRICACVHAACTGSVTIADNCYGEFCEDAEPSALGADMTCGSLIKNPGGGIALTGGYIAGGAEYVELASGRLTVPGIGREAGSNPHGYREMYQGLFLAPHTTAQALKTAVFCAAVAELLGYEADPPSSAQRYDIIQSLILRDPAALLSFCRGIQAGSPVDSHVTPEPWDMPGYTSPVVMAAGAFVQGASIELSADAPMREPYAVFLQGGLTYEAGKIGVIRAFEALLKGE